MQLELENEDNTTTEKKVEIELDTINAAIKHVSPFAVFKRNVSRFFKLFGSSSIKPSNQSHDVSGKTPEEKLKYLKVSNGFDNYLRNDLWKLAIELIDNGYAPSPQQQDKLINILGEIVTKNPAEIVEISKLIKSPSPKLLALALVNNEGVIQDNTQVYKSINTQKGIKDVLGYMNQALDNKTNLVVESLVIQYEMIGSIGNVNSNKEKIKTLHNNILNTSQFIQANINLLNSEDTIEYRNTILNIKNKFISKIKRYSPLESHQYYAENIDNLRLDFFDKFLNDFSKTIEKKFAEDKKELINLARQLNTDKYLENKINTSVVEHILSVERELPKAAQDLLKVINDKYYAATKGNSLPEEVKHEVQNLYENRLPEVLKKFMVIDPEYRIELKNVQGKNAEQLMLESLKNIEEVLDNQIKAANEARLSDLSVTQRYTSAIKHKI